MTLSSADAEKKISDMLKLRSAANRKQLLFIIVVFASEAIAIKSCWSAGIAKTQNCFLFLVCTPVYALIVGFILYLLDFFRTLPFAAVGNRFKKHLQEFGVPNLKLADNDRAWFEKYRQAVENSGLSQETVILLLTRLKCKFPELAIIGTFVPSLIIAGMLPVYFDLAESNAVAARFAPMLTKYLKYYQLRQSKDQPRVHGKVLIAFESSNRLHYHPLNSEISERLQAKTPEEVTVLIVLESKHERQGKLISSTVWKWKQSGQVISVDDNIQWTNTVNVSISIVDVQAEEVYLPILVSDSVSGDWNRAEYPKEKILQVINSLYHD